MGGRDEVKMSDQEVTDFLADNIKVQVASLGPDGAPHLTTLFYIVRDGRIAFWTYAPQPEDPQPRARPPDQRAWSRAATTTSSCAASRSTGAPRSSATTTAIFSIGSEVATRMVGADSFEALGDFGRETVEKQAQKRVAVVIHPDHVATWDHRKMTCPSRRRMETVKIKVDFDLCESNALCEAWRPTCSSWTTTTSSS